MLLVALVGGGAYYYNQTTANANQLIISGTVEATEVRLGSLTGGRVTAVHVQEGDPVRPGEVLVEVSTAGRGKEMVHSPIDGVVLMRSYEPGEIASPGAPLVTVANLDDLNLTIYVPEDRYGQLALGQQLPVTVDSFPGEAFVGTITQIADQAEFTPRNVQTTDSRKTTVFAVKLELPPTGGKLKPGMPADVHFERGQ